MDTKAEKNLFSSKPNSQIEAEMTQKGFVFVGLESLTRFVFTEDARFKASPYRTRDDIRLEYQNRLGGAVEVVLVEEEGLKEGQQAVLVFAKKKD